MVRLEAAETIVKDSSAHEQVQVVRRVFGASLPQRSRASCCRTHSLRVPAVTGCLGRGTGACPGPTHPSIQSPSSAVGSRRDRRHSRFDVFDLIDLTNDKVTSGAKIALVDAAIRQGSHAMEAIKRVFTPGVPSSVRQSAILAVQDAAPELTRALLPA